MMSFEVTVFAMRLNSCFVERVSAVTILVPSDRTTRSKGIIRSAKGNLDKISFEVIPDYSVYPRKALNDNESYISIGRNSAFSAFFVVFGETEKKG